MIFLPKLSIIPYEQLMKRDSLKQFSRLRSALAEERTLLENRLARINNLLGPFPTRGRSLSTAPRRAGARPSQRGQASRRSPGDLSLRKAIIQATSSKPLTKPEILEAVKRLGFRFTTSRPMASLNAYLYRKGEFLRRNGRFSPGKAAR